MTGPFARVDGEHYLDLMRGRFPVTQALPQLKILSSTDSVVITVEPFVGTNAMRGKTLHDVFRRLYALMSNPLSADILPKVLDRAWAGFLLDWIPPGPSNIHQVAAVDPVGRLFLIEERVGWMSAPKVVLNGVMVARENWLYRDLQQLARSGRELRGWMNLN